MNTSCKSGPTRRFSRPLRVAAAERQNRWADELMKPEMTSDNLLNLLQVFESAGIEAWLDGGWAVDAVLGEQTRRHKDVDIILRVSDLPKLCEILRSRGFEIQHGGSESNFILADLSGLEVDVHAIVFDRDGNGI